MSPPDPDDVSERVAALRQRLGPDVELVAVTKGFGPDAVAVAAAAGCTMVGENYAQEITAKSAAFGAAGVDVHFIGRLQSNKVRIVADVVAVWESVDRVSLLDEIARRGPGATVLVQVNATGDGAKGGCPPADVGHLVEHARGLGLVVDGLMVVGPTNGDATETERVFRAVRGLTDEHGLRTCSMGMSGDLDIALGAGTTRVRIGTTLFGARPHPF